MKIPLIYIVTALVAGCTAQEKGFSPREAEIINSVPEGGVMPLYLTTDAGQLETLRAICDPVEASILETSAYRRLLAGMLATVTDPANQGVGIAAPQVGITKRIITVQRFDREGEPFGFYLNPRITEASGETVPSQEGCLSIPGARGYVMRHASIRITYNDPEDFSVVTEDVDGFTAIIFQHEIDHLDGILFTDKNFPYDEEM